MHRSITRHAILSCTITLLLAACGHGTRTNDASGPEKDSLALAALHTDINRLKSSRPALANDALERADSIAQRMDASWASARVQEWKAELMIARNDTDAIPYCSDLVKERAASNVKDRCRSFLVLGEAYNAAARFPQADTAFAQALALARETKSVHLLRDVALDHTANLTTLGRMREAIPLALSAIGDTSASTFSDTQVRLMSNLGSAYFNLSRIDSSFFWHGLALRNAPILKDTAAWIGAISNLTNLMTMQADYQGAMAHLQQGRLLAHEAGLAEREAKMCYNIAAVYEPMRRVEEAMEMVDIAVRITDSVPDPALRPVLLGSKGMLMVQLDSTQCQRRGIPFADRYEQGTALLHTALDMLGSSREVSRIAQFEMALGDILLLQERPAEALPHMHTALANFNKFGNPMYTAFGEMAVANALFGMDNHKEAEPLYRKVLALFEQLGVREYQAHPLEQLHTIEKSKGNLRAAMDMLERAKDISDRMRADSTMKAIANLEADFTYRKKQYADSLAHAAEIREKDLIATRAQLGESTANNRSIIIGSLALLIIGGGFSVYRNRQQRHRRETAEANLKTAEYQNKALRAQMEPHFIRNTIALAIARLRKKSDSSVDDASELLASFSGWIDRVLVTSQHTMHALAEEVNVLTNYLDLQRLRMNGSFNYSVQVDASLDAATVPVPPMLLQPLLENAIEHGLEPQEGKGHIRLGAERKEGGLLLSVEDDGVGRNHPKPERPRTRSASISTANIREQLAQLSERTGKRAEMRIIDLPKGTRVEVQLPM